MFVLCCLVLGSFVQATLGFGMGIVAVPLMVWSGLDLPDAIAALLPNVAVQTSLGCWRNRDVLPWRDVLFLSLWRVLGLPGGVLLLGVVASQGQAISQGVLGIALLGVLAFQQWRPQQSRPPGAGLTAIMGSCSGVLAGLIGMGGPLLVLWVMAQGWKPKMQRSALWLMILAAMPPQIALMLWRFGGAVQSPMLLGCSAIPLVVLTSWFAGKWADRWSAERLRITMRLFLLVIALRLVLELFTKG